MKKKLLTLLIISILSMFMTGCKVEAKNSTGDKELDAQIAELNGYVQDAYKEEVEYEKEREKSLAASKSDSLSINNDSLDFGDIYLVSKNDINAMVFGIKHYEVFPDDTIISIYGINKGEEKLLCKDYMDTIDRSGFGMTHGVIGTLTDIKVPAIQKLDGVIETIQTCFVDWDGYESYRIDIRMEDGDIFEPRVLDTASYEIDSEDLIRVTEEEFIELRAKEILDSLESDQCENEQLLVKYVGADITSTGYNNITLTIENKGNLPVSQYMAEIDIMDSYGNKSGAMTINGNKYIQINPGEVKEFTYSLQTNVGLNIESGESYIVRVFIRDVANDDIVMDSYLKSKFQ